MSYVRLSLSLCANALVQYTGLFQLYFENKYISRVRVGNMIIVTMII